MENKKRRRGNFIKISALLFVIFISALIYNALDFAFTGHNVKSVANNTYLTGDVSASIHFYDDKDGSYTVYNADASSFTYSFAYELVENKGFINVDFNRGDKDPMSFYIIKNGLLDQKNNKFFYKIEV